MGETPTNTQAKNKTPEQLEYLKTHLYMLQKSKGGENAISELFTEQTEAPGNHSVAKTEQEQIGNISLQIQETDHKSLQTEEQGKTCLTCQQKFPTTQDLNKQRTKKTHVKNHGGEKRNQYTCQREKCNKICQNKTN